MSIPSFFNFSHHKDPEDLVDIDDYIAMKKAEQKQNNMKNGTHHSNPNTHSVADKENTLIEGWQPTRKQSIASNSGKASPLKINHELNSECNNNLSAGQDLPRGLKALQEKNQNIVTMSPICINKSEKSAIIPKKTENVQSVNALPDLNFMDAKSSHDSSMSAENHGIQNPDREIVKINQSEDGYPSTIINVEEILGLSFDREEKYDSSEFENSREDCTSLQNSNSSLTRIKSGNSTPVAITRPEKITYPLSRIQEETPRQLDSNYSSCVNSERKEYSTAKKNLTVDLDDVTEGHSAQEVESTKIIRPTKTRYRVESTRSAKSESNERFSIHFPQQIKPEQLSLSGFSIGKAYDVEDPNLYYRRELKKRREKYTDELFCPCLLSLLDNGRKTTKKDWKTFEWKRVSELFRGNKMTVSENISPYDIKPGKIVNHYLLSCFSALAEYPDRVVNLFKTRAFNEEGIYTLRMCKDGTWQDIIIDDFVPTSKENIGKKYAPVFCSSKEIEKNVSVWPILLEKAWAKAYNSYEKILQGTVQETLRNLTGAPCEVIMNDHKRAWQALFQGDELCYIMLAEPYLELEKTWESFGLDSRYCYSILQVCELVTPSRTQKAVQIRNSWSQINMNSELWKKSEEINKNFENDDDCLAHDPTKLWIDFDDFKHLFKCTYINKVHDAYYYEDISVRHLQNAYSAAKLKVDTPMHGFVEVTQIDRRFYQVNKNYKYPTLRLVFARETGEGSYESVRISTTQDLKSNHMEVALTQGVYMLMVFADWGTEIHDLKISFYGDKKLSLERVHTKLNPYLLEKVLSLETITNGVSKPFEGNGEVKKYEYSIDNRGLLIESYTNSTSAPMIVRKTIEKLENLSIHNVATQQAAMENDADISSRQFVELEIEPGASRCFIFTKVDFSKSYELLSNESLRIKETFS